jgi:uncharacterized RDD family membrane protein YckC
MSEQQNVNQGRDQFIVNNPIQEKILHETDYSYWWQRFLAFLIDFVISPIIPLIATSLYYESLPVSFFGGRSASPTVYIVLFALSVIYYPYFEACPLRGTVGKFAMGLAVTNLQGERINFLQSLARFGIKTLVILLILLVFGISCIPIFLPEGPVLSLIGLSFLSRALFRPVPTKKEKQSIYDLIVNCVVEKR